MIERHHQRRISSTAKVIQCPGDILECVAGDLGAILTKLVQKGRGIASGPIADCYNPIAGRRGTRGKSGVGALIGRRAGIVSQRAIGIDIGVGSSVCIDLHDVEDGLRAIALLRPESPGVFLRVPNGIAGKAAHAGANFEIVLFSAECRLDAKLKLIVARVGIDLDIESVLEIDAKAQRHVPAQFEGETTVHRQRQGRLQGIQIE